MVLVPVWYTGRRESIQNKSILWSEVGKDIVRSLTACRTRLLCSLVVRQRILAYLLPKSEAELYSAGFNVEMTGCTPAGGKVLLYVLANKYNGT